MNTLTNLLKDHQIGTWCKRAAWIILAIGLLHIGFYVFNLFQQYRYGGYPLPPIALGVVITSLLGELPSILFYFFILYAAGTLVNHVVAGIEEENDIDEEEDQIDLVGDEEIAPSQMR
jgi:hypothetical protein